MNESRRAIHGPDTRDDDGSTLRRCEASEEEEVEKERRRGEKGR